MNAGELMSTFRNEVMDTEKPYLWTDDEAYLYMNDAYFMLLRFIGGVPDSTTPDCCKIDYAVGDTDVDISPAVLRIVRAFNDSGEEISVIENTDVPLIRNAAGKMSLLRVGSEQAADPAYLVLGSDPYKAKLHPVPTAAGTLTVQVRRLPMNQLTGPTAELSDLPPEHHLHLVKWMKAMAYRKQDADTYDPEKAASNEQSFLEYANQVAFEVSRFRRKSKRSMRSMQDESNPMLSASRSRMYEGEPAQGRRNRMPE